MREGKRFLRVVLALREAYGGGCGYDLLLAFEEGL